MLRNISLFCRINIQGTRYLFKHATIGRRSRVSNVHTTTTRTSIAIEEDTPSNKFDRVSLEEFDILKRQNEKIPEIDHYALGADEDELDADVKELKVEEKKDITLLAFGNSTLKEIIDKKFKYPNYVHLISQNDPIKAALEQMDKHGLGALIVQDDNRMIGIVSARSYVRELVSKGGENLDSPVSKFLVETPIFGYSDDNVLKSLELMSKHHLHYLPVLERADNTVVGIVSIGDLVCDILKQYKETTMHMRNVIHDRFR